MRHQSDLRGKEQMETEQKACATAVLETHRGVHNAGAMGPDGVSNVTDVDGVQMLVVTRFLNEDLLESRNFFYNTQMTAQLKITKMTVAHLVVEVIKVP